MEEKILPSPERARDVNVEWEAVEATVQTALPNDYKEFIQRYGTGKIDDFLWVLSPATNNSHLKLAQRKDAILRALREHRESLAGLGRKLPFAIFPEPGGLLPWGFTDNGDVCYWRTGSDPNTWRVVVNDGRGSMWEEFAGTMTEFLTALLSRRHVSEILTNDEFPSDLISFRPV